MRTCPICGKQFVEKTHSQTCCSYPCRITYHEKRLVENGGKLPTLTKTCSYCGETFTTNLYFQKYCSYECLQAKSQADYRAKKPKRYYEKVCDVCGKHFYTKFKTQKHCSPKCRNAFYKHLKPEVKVDHYDVDEVAEMVRAPKIEVDPANIKPPDKKSLDDWTREAESCGMSYGAYKTQITCFGKTYHELKAAYDARYNREDVNYVD